MGVTARKKGRGQKTARFARHCSFSIMQCQAYTFALATPLLVTQSVHLHDETAKYLIVKTVKEGFSDSTAECCKDTLDDVTEKPANFTTKLIRLFKGKH